MSPWTMVVWAMGSFFWSFCQCFTPTFAFPPKNRPSKTNDLKSSVSVPLISLRSTSGVRKRFRATPPLSRRKLGRLLRRLKPDDVFLCTEISRLGRNLFTIMDVLAKCMRKKVKPMTIKDHFCLVDDLQCKVLAFAFGLDSEIERKLIAQRTTESLARLKAEGKKLGRPKGSLNHKHKLSGKEEVILEGLRSHQSQTQIAKKLKVHRNTLRKFIEDNHLCP